MKTMEITRRQFLKTTGALVVTFNLFSPARKALAQFATLPSGDIDPTSLDSWLAITPDGVGYFLHQQSGTRHRHDHRSGADRRRRTGRAVR